MDAYTTHNIHTFSNDYWFATVDPVLCYGDEATACTLYFSFCRAVPPDVDGACYEAGVCQVGSDGDGNKFGYNMGKFNPHFTQFYESKCASACLFSTIVFSTCTQEVK